MSRKTMSFVMLASLTGAMPLAAAAQTGAAPAAATHGGSTKQEIVETAARIVGAGNALSRIWPGYWPEDQAFILHAEDEGALLISPGPRPAGFEPLPSGSLPSELRGRAFYRQGTMKEAARPFILNFPIGDEKTAVLVNYTRMGGTPVEGRPISASNLVLHEQFHAYQFKAFKAGAGQNMGQFVDPLAFKDRAAFAAAAETEQRILGMALKARSDPERRKLLHQYFALRQEREAIVPTDVSAVERGFERSEGTAKYVDRVAHALIFKGGAAAVPELIVTELERELGASGPFVTTWFRARGYTTGAALTYLLNLYDPLWRQRVEQGGSLDELLKDRVGMPRDTAALAKSARETFGYEARRRRLEGPIREAEKKEIKSVEEFLALDAYSVTVEIEDLKVDGKSTLSAGFSAMDMALLSPAITALPKAFVYSLTGPKVTLAVKERPVLTDRTDTKSRTTVLLQSAPTADGLGVLPAGEHRFERLKLSGPGYELNLERPAIVTVSANNMAIRAIE